MTLIVTNWQMYVTPLDAYVVDPLDGQRKQMPIPWGFGSNAPISIDLTPALEDGEVVTNPTVTLLRLPSSTETDYATYALGLDGGPTVTGAIVSQVLQDLARGYVYRMEVLFGATDNQRKASQLVACY